MQKIANDFHFTVYATLYLMFVVLWLSLQKRLSARAEMSGHSGNYKVYSA